MEMGSGGTNYRIIPTQILSTKDNMEMECGGRNNTNTKPVNMEMESGGTNYSHLLHCINYLSDIHLPFIASDPTIVECKFAPLH